MIVVTVVVKEMLISIICPPPTAPQVLPLRPPPRSKPKLDDLDQQLIESIREAGRYVPIWVLLNGITQAQHPESRSEARATRLELWSRLRRLIHDGQVFRFGRKSVSLVPATESTVRPDDHAAYRELRATKAVPIASGEHEPDEAGFQDLIDSQAADYIQMDVCCQGGFAMGQRIFALVAKKRLRFAFHSWGTALEVLAAAHLGICWPADVVEWLEYPCYSNFGRPGMYSFPLADEILGEPLAIEGGDLIVPNGPGLGVEIDESVFEKYPFISGPWSFFRIDSPAETVAVTGDHSVKWVAAGSSPDISS